MDVGLLILGTIILAFVSIFAIIFICYAKESGEKIRILIHSIVLIAAVILIIISVKTLKKDLHREIINENIISIYHYEDNKCMIETNESKSLISNELVKKASISNEDMLVITKSDLGNVRFVKLYLTPETYKSLGY